MSNYLGNISLTGVDAEEVSARILGSMSEEKRRGFVQEMQRMMQDMETTAETTSTREGLIATFLKSRADMAATHRRTGQNTSTVYFTTSQSDNVKPSTLKSVALEDCCPLTIESLAINTAHQYRHLCGKVAVADSFRLIHLICFLLEDIRGDLVRVAVFNTDRTFRLNEEFTIMAPFYKIAADMIPVVRVDQPKEIVPWNAPLNASDWKKLGDGFYMAEDGVGALYCYETGTSVDSCRKEIATLLTNIAICQSNLDRFQASVWYAGAAVFLDPENIKAWYRLLSSLYEVTTFENWLEVARESANSKELNQLIQCMNRCRKPNPCDAKSACKGIDVWSDFDPLWTWAPSLENWQAIDHDRPMIRKEANTLFGKKQYEAACQMYVKELQLRRGEMAVYARLTCNMSAALKLLGRPSASLLACTVSCWLDKSSAKAWIRRSELVDNLNGSEAAMFLLEGPRMNIATEMASSTTSSLIKRCAKKVDELKQKLAHRPHVKVVSGVTTDEQIQDRRRREFCEEQSDPDL